MKFEVEYIEKLAKVLADNSLTEISLEEGEYAITIRKEVFSVAAPVAAVSTPASSVSAAQSSAAPKVEVKKGNAITSPMVGTFYRASSPDTKSFASIGDTVSKGDVICIVEAMKLMNEIESEFSGKVVEICVEDGQPVEFGQVLMYIE